VYASVQRTALRAAFWTLWLSSFVRKPHGRGVKALLINEGEVLFVRHTYGPREWELPGGGARKREDLVNALRRELREELEIGFADADATMIGVFAGPGRWSGVDVGYFRVELADRNLTPDPIEIAQVAWFDPMAPPLPLGWHARRALDRHREAVASA